MKYLLVLAMAIPFLITGCSSVKSVEEGEVLYGGSRIHIHKKKYSKKWKIKDPGNKLSLVYWHLWDTPNGSFMGLPALRFMPIRLWIYNDFYTQKNKDKNSGFAHWMRENFGQAPILIEDVNPELKLAKAIDIYENFGHFRTKGDLKLNYKKKGKKCYVHYHLYIPHAYTYRNITFVADSMHSEINDHFRAYQPNSLLKEGDEFNLFTLDQEKTQIWTHLQNLGYYFLREDDIYIQADTSVGQKQIDLRIHLRRDLGTWNYQQESVDITRLEIDSTIQDRDDSNYYYYGTGRVRKRLLDSLIKIEPNEHFSLDHTRETVQKLSDIGVFESPRVSYTVTGSDSTHLLGTVSMSPIDATQIGFNLKGNYKNTGYLGPSAGFRLSQLNVFGGAENLTVDGDVYYDFPIGVFRERVSPSSGFSLRSLISAPLLRSPFSFINDRYGLPRQYLSLNFEYNDRKDYFNFTSWNTSYGFEWKSGQRSHNRLDLVGLTFTNIRNTTIRFDTVVAENPVLEKTYSDQVILGSSYTYTYNNSSIENKRLGVYFQGQAEIAGNLLDLGSAILSDTPQKERKFLGVSFSQFARFQYDFRAYLSLGPYNELVFRHLGGIGFAYGNSEEIPYTRQYFVGGSNSLRPLNARSVGPGRYIELDEAEVNQVGDIKLEWNLEYRMKLFIKLYGAIWADFGNIWLLNEDPNRNLSGIRWNKIFKDSYLNTGIGLRLDLDFLVLRADYGVILYAPIFIDDYRWIWQNGLPLHGPVIGFGYPF